MLPVTLSSDRVRLDLPTRSDTAAITAACPSPMSCSGVNASARPRKRRAAGATARL